MPQKETSGAGGMKQDFVNLRFFVDGYHLTPDGIPVLVDAIHKAGALQEQTGPHLVLFDSKVATHEV